MVGNVITYLKIILFLKEGNQKAMENNSFLELLCVWYVSPGFHEGAGVLGAARTQLQLLQAARDSHAYFSSFNALCYHFFNVYPLVSISTHKKKLKHIHM